MKRYFIVLVLLVLASRAFSTVYYVTLEGGGDGSAWDNAYSAFDAIGMANDGDILYFRNDVYNNAFVNFIVDKNITIYGGFTNETSPELRNPKNKTKFIQTHFTITSGTGATIDGFSFTRSFIPASGNTPDSALATIAIAKSAKGEVVLNNLSFTQDDGFTLGPAFYLNETMSFVWFENPDPSLRVLIDNCNFSNPILPTENMQYGIIDAEKYSSLPGWKLTIQNTVFRNLNTYKKIVAALTSDYVSSGTPLVDSKNSRIIVDRCKFINCASGSIPVLFIHSNMEFSVTNTLFAGNAIAANFGGLGDGTQQFSKAGAGYGILRNCTFAPNNSEDIWLYGNVTATNNIFYTQNILFHEASNISFLNNLLFSSRISKVGADLSSTVAGDNPIISDPFAPLFVNKVNDYRITPNLIVKDRCAPVEDYRLDLDGNLRDAKPDIGAYEFDDSCVTLAASQNVAIPYNSTDFSADKSTIRFWMRADAIDRNDKLFVIKDKSENEWITISNDASGMLYASVGGAVALPMNKKLFPGEWIHIGITANGSQVTFYVNGKSNVYFTSSLKLDGTQGAAVFAAPSAARISVDEFSLWDSPSGTANIPGSINQSLSGNETELKTLFNFNNRTKDSQTGGYWYSDQTGNDTKLHTESVAEPSLAVYTPVINIILIKQGGFEVQLQNDLPATTYLLSTDKLLLGTSTNHVNIVGNYCPTGYTASLKVTTDYGAFGLKDVEIPRSQKSLVLDPTSALTVKDKANPLIGSNTYTVETWFKPTADGCIFDLAGSGSGIMAVVKNNVLAIIFYVEGSFKDKVEIPVLINAWSHLAIVSDAASGATTTVYLNGVEVAKSGLTPITRAFQIGSDSDGYEKFTGELDEFRVWGVAQTLPNILASIYASLAMPANNLLLYYNFDNYCTADVHDVSGNGHDGMVENTLGESFVASTAMNTPCGVELALSEGCDTKIKWEAMPGVSAYTVNVYNKEMSLQKSISVDVNEAYIDGLVHDASYIVGITTDKGYSSIAYPFTAASSFFASSTTDLVKCEGQTLYVEPNETNFKYSSSWTLPDNTENNSSVFSKDKAQVSDGGKYTYVRTWDYTECKDTVEYTLAVNPLPTVNAIPDTVLAIGSTTISQTISDDNDFIGASISETNKNIDIDVKTLAFNPTELLSQKEFTLTVANSNNCTNTETFSITEVDPLTITIDGTTSICANEPFSLKATVTGGSGDYTYSWGNNGATVLSESNSLDYAAGTLSAHDHEFTLTVKDNIHKHIVASKNVTVTVKAMPVITIEDEYSFCQNAPATVTPKVTDGSTIEWSASVYLTVGNETVLEQSINTSNAINSAELTITATLDGCSVVKSTMLSITSPLEDPNFDLPVTGCEGVPIILTTNTGNYTVDGDEVTDYQFTPKLTNGLLKQKFSVTHSIGSLKCPNPATKELTVYAYPTVSPLAKDTELCKSGDVIDFTKEQGVFTLGTTELEAFYPGNQSTPSTLISYSNTNEGYCPVEETFTITVHDPQTPEVLNLRWTTEDTDTTITATSVNTIWYDNEGKDVGKGLTFTPALTIAGTYHFTYSEKIGECESDRAKITIVVEDANCPSPTISPVRDTVCQNEVATFSSDLTTTLWFTSEARKIVSGEGSIYKPSTAIAGTFTYYALNKTSCESDSVLVTLIVNPLPDVSVAEKVTVQKTSPAVLSASSLVQEGLYTYAWSPAEMLVSTDVATVQTLPIEEDTEFTLTVTNIRTECLSEHSVTVTPLPAVIPLTSIVLPANAGYSVGDEAQLSASLFPADATDPELIWTSSNTAVATVSATGHLTAVSKGIAEIRASNRSNTVSATLLATVNELPVAVTGISLPDSVVLQLSAGSYQFAPVVAPFNASAPTLVWSIRGTSVIQVDAQSGAIQLLNTGTDTVIVKVDGTDLSAQCRVVVRASLPIQQIKALPVLYSEAGVAEKFFSLASYYADDHTAPADIRISLKNNEPAKLSLVNNAGKATFSGMTEGDSLVFTILLQDADGNVTETPATLVVLGSATNKPPVIATVTDQSKSGENYSQIVLADLVIDDFTMPENIDWVAGNAPWLEAEIVDGVLTVKPKAGDWVTDTLSVTAVDKHGQQTIIRIVYNNSSFNKAPQLRTIADQIRNERSDFAPIYLNAHVTDDNTSPADIRWTLSPTKRLKITIVNQVANIEIADKSWVGTEIVRFTAMDAKGLVAYTNVAFSQLRQPEVPVSGGFFFADFTAPQTTAARGTGLRLYADMKGAAYWKWLLDGAPISESNNYNPLVTSKITGRHTVSLIVSDGEHFDTVTKPMYLNFVGIRENSMALCKGQSMTFHASDPTFDKYEWSNNTEGIAATIAPQKNTFIYLTITDILFTYEDKIQVWVLQPMSLGADTAFCQGQECTVKPQISPEGAKLVSYQWNNGSSSPSITVGTAGAYSLSATDEYGCKWADTMHVTELYQLPEVDLGDDAEYCYGLSVQLNAGSAGKYLWSTGADKPTIAVDTTGTYWVQVTDANKCQNTDTVHLDFLVPYREPLGVVTFSDDGRKFIAAWERTPGKRTERYELMCEKGGLGRYTKLADRNYNDSLYYVDSTSIATQQTYRYKLVTVDSVCGNRAESLPHRTMLISTSRGLEDTDVNIRFTAYVGIPVSEYIIYKVRGSILVELGRIIEDGHAEYSFVHSAHKPGDRYRVVFELDHTIVLSSLKNDSGPFSQSMSNLSEAIVLESASQVTSSDLYLYPNPTEKSVFVQIPDGFDQGIIQIINLYGQSVLEYPYIRGSLCQPIDLAPLPAGTYNVVFVGSNTTARATVVKE